MLPYNLLLFNSTYLVLHCRRGGGIMGGKQRTTLFMGIGESRSEQRAQELEKKGKGKKGKKKK